MENARSGLRRFIPYLRRHRRALALILLLSIAVAFIVLLPVQIISAAVDDLSGASARSSFSVWIGLAGGRPLAYPCLFFIFYALSQAASTFYGDRARDRGCTCAIRRAFNCSASSAIRSCCS